MVSHVSTKIFRKSFYAGKFRLQQQNNIYVNTIYEVVSVNWWFKYLIDFLSIFYSFQFNLIFHRSILGSA